MFKMKLLTTLFSLLVLTATLQAQTRTISPDSAPVNDGRLDANYSLQLAGAYSKDAPLDVTLQGAGPKFETRLSAPPTTIEMILRQEGEKYLVLYAIAIQTPTTSPSKNGAAEYRDTSLTGSAIVQLGKPFTLATINGQALTLTVSQVKVE